MSTLYNYQITIKNFYKDRKLNFKNINEEFINKLKEKAYNLNIYYNNKYPKTTNIERYIKIIEVIQKSFGSNNDDLFNTTNTTEKYLLHMFSIDPNFEAFIIYSSFNNVKEIKQEIIKTFGIYDPTLIEIEKHFIKYFFNQNEKDKINNEIENRVFK